MLCQYFSLGCIKEQHALYVSKKTDGKFYYSDSNTIASGPKKGYLSHSKFSFLVLSVSDLPLYPFS
jgi:hypothetical protein